MSTTLSIKPSAMMNCATEFGSTVKEIDNALKTVISYTALMKLSLDDDTAKTLFANLDASIESITDIVAAFNKQCRQIEEVAQLYEKADAKIKASI